MDWDEIPGSARLMKLGTGNYRSLCRDRDLKSRFDLRSVEINQREGLMISVSETV